MSRIWLPRSSPDDNPDGHESLKTCLKVHQTILRLNLNLYWSQIAPMIIEDHWWRVIVLNQRATKNKICKISYILNNQRYLWISCIPCDPSHLVTLWICYKIPIYPESKGFVNLSCHNINIISCTCWRTLFNTNFLHILCIPNDTLWIKQLPRSPSTNIKYDEIINKPP